MKQRTIISGVIALLTLVIMGSSLALADTYELPSLREIYEEHFHLGAAVSVASWAPKALVVHEDLVQSQFSSLTAENAMKPDYLQSRHGVFNFREADNMIRYAQDNDMVVRGHTLVWHAQTGDWVFRDQEGNRIDEKTEVTEADRQLVIDRMESHIEGVMSYFGDSVYAWDVVNEAVTDDTNHIHRLDSPWYRTVGEDFIKIAFRKAHEVNPDIKLFYNDYNAVAPYKRGRIITMLQDMIDDGVPIHGMGIQGHWSVDGPSISEIEDALKLYADLGLKIHITELDVGMDGATEEQQAERYGEIFQLFKKYSDVITSVTFWGVSDDFSWRGEDDALLFNREHEPKPAFWAVVNPDKPWYVNKAEYTGAVVFKDNTGKDLDTLKPGEYTVNSLDFSLEEVAKLDVIKGHLVTFYESEDFQGDSWHFISTDQFNGTEIANRAKSFTINYVEAVNVALNKPVDANIRPDRAARAVDGDIISSWSPSDTPPYWLMVDLEEEHLLNRWVVKLQGSGPLAGGTPSSPLNAADFGLQISDDGVNWQDADIVEGNTASITDRDLNLVTARYVRLYVTRPTSLDFNKNLVVQEFEVYGTPVKK